MSGKISLIFLLVSFLGFSQPDIRVISSDATSLVFEFLPQFTDTSVININGKEFRKVAFSGGALFDIPEPGFPLLLERSVNIGVPDEFGTTLEVLNTSYTEIRGMILPVPEYDQPVLSEQYYRLESEYYNSSFSDELVRFGEFGTSRGLKIQSFIISPVQFDAASGRIRIHNRILVRINFSGGTKFSEKPADKLLSDVVINFNIARFWKSEHSERFNKSVSNSVLSTGRWFKFEAPDEGIYKISRSMLASMGIDANTVDPRTIKIYNNGGTVLSENMNQPRPVDLVENAITVAGQEDGRFDESDYILFYGRGSSFWDIGSNGTVLSRMRHPYSDKNYFWITSGGEPGKRIGQKTGTSAAPDFIQTRTQAFVDWEIDRINLGKSGRQFFGDDFSTAVNSRTYLNNLPYRDNNEPLKYSGRFVIGTQNGMELIVSDNGNQVFAQTLSGYGSSSYIAGREYSFTSTLNAALPDNRSALTFKVNPASVSSIGYIDFFEIEYKRSLTADNDYLVFFSEPYSGIIEYQLHGFTSSNIKVYDVTDYSDIKLVTPLSGWPSGSEFRFRANESLNQRSKYIAVGSDKFKSPVNTAEVPNSNIRGESVGAQFIIVTHKNFIDAAVRLKNYRESQSVTPLSTIVVDIDHIFNEFSGGMLDVSAIRDYLKHAYDNWQVRPEYVLFFGKGTYDYRNTEGYSDNFIPTWQTVQSLALLNSYVTDDFFVQVEGLDPLIDIALGRIPVTNAVEADNVVSKIIQYENSSENGSWRNLITFVADDGIGTGGGYEGTRHTRPTEQFAETVIPGHFDKNKIYAAAYPEVITGQGRRKPDVNKSIIEAMNNGTLFINYIGHGSPELWAHEYIFEKSVALPQLNNDKYFFICAATCDFGYFDIPNFQSSTEAMLFLPNSGSIGGFTSARLVFSFENELLNELLLRNIFLSERDTLNLPIRIGEAVYKSKILRSGVNDQKYGLIGDPTLRLKIPQYNAMVDSVNGLTLNTDVQVKALSKTKIDGVILKPDSTVWEEFNGEGLLTVYDSERLVRIESISTPTSPFNMKQQGGVIFKGRVSVNNGRFLADFVVPKDIAYENQNGKIVFYFFNNSADGIGFTNSIVVGGTDSTTNDGKGPELEIYFDDISYGTSYLVGPNPKLIVKLNDETGLNTTGTGIGHKLEGVLNEQENNPIDFTNYFVGDLDAGGKSGQVNYTFNNLEFGEYSILIKAWDVFNNFSSEISFFSVVNDNALVIRDVYNYPNPFASSTTFTFNQNLTEAIDVKIRIYTIAGRMIKEIERFNINEKFVTIDWDGRDQDGNNIANGTYLYKVIVKTVSGERSSSVTGKMAVIR